MGNLVEAVKSSFFQKTTAPGKAVIVQTKPRERTTELYHSPGISSAPTAGDRVVEIPLGSGTRVAIATHNYRLEISVSAGETIIYSTDSTGETLKAQIKLDANGFVSISNESQDLAALMSDLVGLIKGLITTGSPSAHTVNGASKTLLDNWETQVMQLLKEAD